MHAVPWKLLVAAAILYLLYLFGLDRVGLLSTDEPRYASIGREMARSGDWITPRLWGEPWFEKPALLYWMVGAGYKAGLPDDLAARVPVALLCIAFLLLYFYRMRREFGATAALYSSLMLGTSAGWLAYGQIAVTDLPLAATFSAAMSSPCPGFVREAGADWSPEVYCSAFLYWLRDLCLSCWRRRWRGWGGGAGRIYTCLPVPRNLLPVPGISCAGIGTAPCLSMSLSGNIISAGS